MGSLIDRLLAAIRRILRRRQPAEVCDNSDGALTDKTFVIVSTPTSGMRVRSGFDVKGCSNTFESSVTWRLLDRPGNELASGHTTGGGMDGFAPFSFTVAFTVASPQIGHLEVTEYNPADDSEGGFPAMRNVIPLVLLP